MFKRVYLSTKNKKPKRINKPKCSSGFHAKGTFNCSGISLCEYYLVIYIELNLPPKYPDKKEQQK